MMTIRRPWGASGADAWAWVMVNVRPKTVSVPARALPVVFAATA